MQPPDKTPGRRTLTDYPRPSVAVDAALLTLGPDGDELLVLQVRRRNGPGWSLPGTFLHPGERLSDAVNRVLRDKAGVQGLRPRQLHVFDDPGRDDRGWVLSVAHVDVVRGEHLAGRLPDNTRLTPVAAPGRLPFDHREIIGLAVEDLRSRYLGAPDPDGLLPEEFTMRELLAAHRAVAGQDLQRDWFRRTMEPQLAATGRLVSAGRGRPAEVFRRLSR